MTSRPSTGLVRSKSSYSGNHDATCVETARLDVRVGVRDSKDRQGPVLLFSRGARGGFLAGVKTERDTG
ncbi:DUF397 domain-containing protein [Streptomyces sp. NPDC058371]|uniref:DUF397 domain-containing protein n=1 Tax=Streptomyces sp. NPDC058371 TaxID=3346463 RepID=UPI003650B556